MLSGRSPNEGMSSRSGLHSVVSGTKTFFEFEDSTGTPIVGTTGQGYLDAEEDAHIARNESGSPAQNVVTYPAPPGAP